MALVGVTLVAIALLYLLTTLALTLAGRVRHPVVISAMLATLLVAGVALLFD
jgi:hypothetical protein